MDNIKSEEDLFSHQDDTINVCQLVQHQGQGDPNNLLDSFQLSHHINHGWFVSNT